MSLPTIQSPCLQRFPIEQRGFSTSEAADTQYHGRHVEMLTDPEVIETIKARSALVKAMRGFFEARSFVEVGTPILTALAGGATARPFETTATEFSDRKLSLRIAPELWLKRLIIGGMERVFEIGPCFRNEGLDKTHNPEFTTCEFYAVRHDLMQLMDSTKGLLSDMVSAVEALPASAAPKTASLLQSIQGPYQVLDFIPSLNAALGVDLPNLSSSTAHDSLLRLFSSRSLAIPANPTVPRLVDKLSSIYLEPRSVAQPTWILNIPECLSPLAKSFTHLTAPNAQPVAARAELFIQGNEVVNCYEEENDPFKQRRKFIDQQRYAHQFSETGIDEEAMKLDEQQEEKQLLQAEYDSFQDIVLNPLHDMLNERISKLTTLMHELEDLLTSEIETANLDRIQEEGDEAPHLLEKLTQLKWLFDSRETLHQEVFQLLSERNDRYKNIVLLPYQQAGNTQKVNSTQEFFAQDYKDRKATFRRESFNRYSTHLGTMEQHVRRGIELQSSTYWDIVPGLLDLLQRIPEDLRDFGGILIPENELVENPSYQRHPLQYLYSIMSHAEKSCYQFIESQINLQCLLHGAKTSMATARNKYLRAECQKDGGNVTELRTISEATSAEEASLTVELRQATDLVEQQWSESLGRSIEEAKRRVKARLMVEGGWDEMEQEEVIP